MKRRIYQIPKDCIKMVREIPTVRIDNKDDGSNATISIYREYEPDLAYIMENRHRYDYRQVIMR